MSTTLQTRCWRNWRTVAPSARRYSWRDGPGEFLERSAIFLCIQYFLDIREKQLRRSVHIEELLLSTQLKWCCNCKKRKHSDFNPEFSRNVLGCYPDSSVWVIQIYMFLSVNVVLFKILYIWFDRLVTDMINTNFVKKNVNCRYCRLQRQDELRSIESRHALSKAAGFRSSLRSLVSLFFLCAQRGRPWLQKINFRFVIANNFALSVFTHICLNLFSLVNKKTWTLTFF